MLTAREKEAAQLIAEGANRADIARRTAVSVSTVDKRIRSLKTKLGARGQIDLVIRCRDMVLAGGENAPLMRDPIAYQRDVAAPSVARFADAEDIEALFAALLEVLAGLGVTHAAYSHVRKVGDEPIIHIATRWSFPPDVGFDMSIPPDENLAFRYAMQNWSPAPLDLEAMRAAEFYDLVPEAIRAQNAVFEKAGLVRGLTYPLPGLTHEDRLVLSVLWQHVSAPRFQRHVAEDADTIHLVLLAFRSAHVGLARPRVALQPREMRMLREISEGAAPEEAAASLGLSRRAGDRLLASVRDAYGVPSNAAAVASYLQDRWMPVLPF